jgi:hypothetical protein
MKTRLFTFAAVLFAAVPCFGQEFCIFTTIYDESSAATADAKPPVVARPVTLFHAGRVYDWMPTQGEVIIFEPMQDRFTVLNTKQQIATTVHTDEIKHLLQSARRLAGESGRKLRAGGRPADALRAGMLAFQLKPDFRHEFDAKAKSLSLISPHLRYDVRLEFVETKEYAEAYRKYADWVNRLNFVMQPRLLLPGPRLALNKALAEKQALPLEVKLRLNTTPAVQLRAAHVIQWKLERKERQMINSWNTLLTRPTTKKVPLRQYQKLLGMRTTSR